MGMLFILLLVVAGSMGASYLLLFGVTDWWKLANSDGLAAEEAQKIKGKAISKVTMAFTLWGTILVFVISSMQMGMTLQVLQAVGVDVSAFQQGQ